MLSASKIFFLDFLVRNKIEIIYFKKIEFCHSV